MFKGRQDINLGDLTNFIIEQRNIGSVITQSHEDQEEDVLDEGHIFGIGTIIRLTQTESPLATQIKEYLVRIAESSRQQRLSNFLNAENRIGFIISERIENIPPQISVPLYETLFNEVKKAKAKNLPFDFTHYILLSRCLKPREGSDEEEGKIFYVNAEEEVFCEKSDMVIPVRQEPEEDVQQRKNDEGSRSRAGEPIIDIEDLEYFICSKILIFSADKADMFVNKITELLPY